MPHLLIQYSSNLEARADISAFCELMRQKITTLTTYPLGGIRVRAEPQKHYALADGHQDNAFIDMIFRLGKGRSFEQKQETGDLLMQETQDFFKDELAKGYLMASLELVELQETSWKVNPIHARINKGA